MKSDSISDDPVMWWKTFFANPTTCLSTWVLHSVEQQDSEQVMCPIDFLLQALAEKEAGEEEEDGDEEKEKEDKENEDEIDEDHYEEEELEEVSSFGV